MSDLKDHAVIVTREVLEYGGRDPYSGAHTQDKLLKRTFVFGNMTEAEALLRGHTEKTNFPGASVTLVKVIGEVVNKVELKPL